MNFSSSSKDTSAQQQTQQNTTTNPWAPAIPALQDLLTKLQGTSTDVTPAQTQAFNTLESNAAQGDPNAAADRSLSTDLLNSKDYTGTANNAYSTLQGQLGGIANGDDLDIQNNPEIQALLKTVQNNTTSAVNQQFAGAGRDMSGINQRAIGTGVANAEAPILLNQYNTERTNQANAAEALNQAGNTNATTDSSLDQARAALRAAGIDVGNSALQAENYAPTQTLNLEQQKTQLPFSNLGMLASILFPAAGLGGSSSGTANTTGTSNTDTNSFGLKLSDLFGGK